LSEKEQQPKQEHISVEEPMALGDDIMKMLNERTRDPGEAFVLLQKLSIFIWDQYKVDWSEHPGHPVSPDRKQRCLDFIGQLIDVYLSNQDQAKQ